MLEIHNIALHVDIAMPNVMLQAKAGVVMNIVCVVATTVATETIGMAYFDLNTLPWPTNSTTT